VCLDLPRAITHTLAVGLWEWCFYSRAVAVRDAKANARELRRGKRGAALLEKLRARVEAGGGGAGGSGGRSGASTAPRRKRADSDASDGGDNADGMDWDELWASDSDGDVTEDVPAPKSTILQVDIPALPLRILLSTATHTDSSTSGGDKPGGVPGGPDSLEGVGSAVEVEGMEGMEGSTSSGPLSTLTTSLSARRAQLFHRCFPFSKVCGGSCRLLWREGGGFFE
jgi:hypothetical protein